MRGGHDPHGHMIEHVGSGKPLVLRELLARFTDLEVCLRRRPSALMCCLALSACLISYATVISPVEVLSADDLGRRRDWSDEEKVRIVEESLQGFRQGSATARRYGLSRSLFTTWRREYRNGLLSVSASLGFMPLSISPPAVASCERASPRPEDDRTIEIGLPTGLRLTIPASLGPTILARLLPVLDAS